MIAKQQRQRVQAERIFVVIIFDALLHELLFHALLLQLLSLKSLPFPLGRYSLPSLLSYSLRLVYVPSSLLGRRLNEGSNSFQSRNRDLRKTRV